MTVNYRGSVREFPSLSDMCKGWKQFSIPFIARTFHEELLYLGLKGYLYAFILILYVCISVYIDTYTYTILILK